MPIESPIVDLSSLNENWPLDNLPDKVLEGDDHLRLTKDAIKKAFTDLSSNGGVVTVTAVELNHLSGAIANIQQQLNAVEGRWVYSNAATLTPDGGEKYLLDPPTGGVVITLPNTPLGGVEIQAMDVSGNADPPNNTITFVRSGVNLIRDVDTQTNGLTSIALLSGQHRYFVFDSFDNNTWMSWSIS